MDLTCDICGRYLHSPDAAVRFVYHPGIPELRDDTGAACPGCWAAVTRALDLRQTGRCAACGAQAPRRQSLHVHLFSDPGTWRLCAADAIGFLNSLRTVEPKLDAATFRFPGAPEEA